MTTATLKSTQAQFTLQDGRIRTAWTNWDPKNVGKKTPKQLILLFHGFPDISDGWRPIIEILDGQFPNTLVLAPTMKGYEPSSTGLPTGEYSLEKVAEEFLLWSYFSLEQPVHLVGHDWGAVTCFRALNLYPKAFTSVVTMAIPHSACSGIENILKNPKQIYLSSYFLTMNIPYLYRPKINSATPIPYIQGLIEYWSPTWKMPTADLAAICNTLHIEGVTDSSTAYYRNLHKALGRSKWVIDWSKIKVIGGRQDGCMTVGLFEIDKAAHPNNVVIIDHVGHFMQREDPKRLAQEIISHIQTTSG